MLVAPREKLSLAFSVLVTVMVGFCLATDDSLGQRKSRVNRLHLITGLVMLALEVTVPGFVLTGRK